jgi:hypothetical protein
MDNLRALSSVAWQVHVYGEASADIQSACRARQLPLCTFPWTDAAAGAGLRRDAVYLVRPDGYVGLAAGSGHAQSITSYLDAHGLIP